MLSLIADIAGAYFIARKVKRKPVAILLCGIIGVVSAIVMNLAIYVVASDVFAPKEILTRIIGGSVIHPFITLLAWCFWARKNKPVQTSSDVGRK